jgi:hypothetical protein
MRTNVTRSTISGSKPEASETLPIKGHAMSADHAKALVWGLNNTGELGLHHAARVFKPAAALRSAHSSQSKTLPAVLLCSGKALSQGQVNRQVCTILRPCLVTSPIILIP